MYFVLSLLVGWDFRVSAIIAVCAGFVYFSYTEYELKNTILSILCGLVAVLFNPLKPIYFKKETWHPIDMGIAVAVIIWIIIDLLSLKFSKRNKEKYKIEASAK